MPDRPTPSSVRANSCCFAMVGGYLDGWAGVESSFMTAARRAAGLE